MRGGLFLTHQISILGRGKDLLENDNEDSVILLGVSTFLNTLVPPVATQVQTPMQPRTFRISLPLITDRHPLGRRQYASNPPTFRCPLARWSL